jgi:hypothetical protein
VTSSITSYEPLLTIIMMTVNENKMGMVVATIRCFVLIQVLKRCDLPKGKGWKWRFSAIKAPIETAISAIIKNI